MITKTVKERFNLTGRVAVITGGAGLLGKMHAKAIAEFGGIPVIADIKEATARKVADEISGQFKVNSIGIKTDVASFESVRKLLKKILLHYKRIDILINNAAYNPKVEDKTLHKTEWSRFENFSLGRWNKDLAVGLTGAFICSQVIGTEMSKRKRGVILNIASDLAIIAPNQHIYQKADLPEHLQPVKPVSYSVVKAGLLILTKYLATYWADKNIRVNALSLGGVYNNQPDEFVKRLTNLIPMKRMAQKDEYKAAIIFLCSDASSYMTGSNLVIDGGRTAW